MSVTLKVTDDDFTTVLCALRSHVEIYEERVNFWNERVESGEAEYREDLVRANKGLANAVATFDRIEAFASYRRKK